MKFWVTTVWTLQAFFNSLYGVFLNSLYNVFVSCASIEELGRISLVAYILFVELMSLVGRVCIFQSVMVSWSGSGKSGIQPSCKAFEWWFCCWSSVRGCLRIGWMFWFDSIGCMPDGGQAVSPKHHDTKCCGGHFPNFQKAVSALVD